MIKSVLIFSCDMCSVEMRFSGFTRGAAFVQARDEHGWVLKAGLHTCAECSIGRE